MLFTVTFTESGTEDIVELVVLALVEVEIAEVLVEVELVDCLVDVIDVFVMLVSVFIELSVDDDA